MEAIYAATVLGWSVYLLCWLFLVYSFLGVVIETVFCLVRERHLESRLGMLYLPLRPMYGVGGVASTLLLDRFQHQPDRGAPRRHADRQRRRVHGWQHL